MYIISYYYQKNKNNEITFEKIIQFLNKENEGIIKIFENDNRYRILIEKLYNYSKGIKGINFGFNLSILLKAMEEGEWILLDDINFAPSEIERLTSLLEEESTLTIYEDSPTKIYKKKKQ